MTRRWILVSSLGLLLASALSGCDDECKKGKSECLSDGLIRTCVPGDGDNTWLVHQCGDDEVCDPDAVPADSARDAGSTGFGAACVGTCDVGQSECVSAELSRYCVNGKVWELDACNVGEACVDGVCRIGTDGGVRACVPGTKACASELIEKVCDGDGSSWVEQACAANEICLGTECIPDPRSSCDDGNRCLDNKTSIRCLGEDRGFELVRCGDGNWCEGGRCRGINCSIGSTCNGLNQVRECSDGVDFVDTQCGDNEVCRQDKDTARCETRVCSLGTTVCGDPEDDAADVTKTFSQCVIGANTGVPGWSRGECTGNLVCDSALAATSNPCRQACTPGAETCATDPAAAIQDGWRVCQEDGTWGPVQTCNPAGDQRLQCALRPNREASELPTHVCAEPVCAFLFNGVGFGGGTCDGADIRRCSEDGTLESAAACETGFCRVFGTTQTDGRRPGACDDDARCQEGEERCVTDNFTPTPVYQTCAGGEWSSDFSTCPDDTLCLDYLDVDGMSRKLCDAECIPGYHRCNGDNELETCDGDGAWGSGVACDVGRCQATGANDAACVLDCVPGELLCAGDPTLASDNASQGTTMEVPCNADGTLGTPEACGTDEACRTSATGIVLGCLECVGPNAPGGNAQGLVDSRCDPAMSARIQACGTGDTWDASRACGSGKTCIGASGPTCGDCTSASGNTVVCTESNIDDIQTCGACLIPLDDAGSSTVIGQCTEANIQALNAAESCNSLFGGGTTSWGGLGDCCNGDAGAYLLTSGLTCGNLGYGVAVPWGGEPDCCSFYQQAAGGPAFAYCGP